MRDGDAHGSAILRVTKQCDWLMNYFFDRPQKHFFANRKSNMTCGLKHVDLFPSLCLPQFSTALALGHGG